MATKPESKIDAAAEKAYAEAAAKKVEAKTEAKGDVSVAKVAEAVEADKPAPKAAPAKKKPAAKKAAAPKKAVAKKKAAAKKTAKKAVAKKTSAKKAAPRKTAAKAAAKTTKNSTKETIMTKAKTQTADMTAKLKEGLADMQTRAKTFYGKGAELVTDMGEFTKGNAEAVVASAKIYANGVQEIAKTQFADVKTVAEVVTADVKEMAAVKSPTEFVQLQGKIATRNFDATVAQVSKTTEMWVKLANDTFAPISNRASVAMEKVRKAA
uniref:phasin family protein n=1 Tax=Parerythrobacter lutipelagi TaxID=1964208 RepID=UPI0010F48C77|nr:phasin family protein [Parerythrobacter lutipelagi]